MRYKGSVGLQMIGQQGSANERATWVCMISEVRGGKLGEVIRTQGWCGMLLKKRGARG